MKVFARSLSFHPFHFLSQRHPATHLAFEGLRPVVVLVLHLHLLLHLVGKHADLVYDVL